MEEYFNPIWEQKDLYTADGIPTIILPSDPNALLEWFDLLMASKAAGNTETRNELVTIYDELLRQDVFDKYINKQIMLKL